MSTLTYKLDTEAHELWEQGLTDPEIGKRLGCSRATVGRWRKKNSLDLNTIRTKVSKEGHFSSTIHYGSEYTKDEVEFLKAIDTWKTRERRIPTYPEVLIIAKSLGWRKE